MIDSERAHIDLENSLSRMRFHLKDPRSIPRENKEEAAEIARQYHRRLLQVAEIAQTQYKELKRHARISS